jgi:aminodeoxyfutalosine deaminase
LDLNQGPSGYEPDELPDCSTPRRPSSKYTAPIPPGQCLFDAHGVEKSVSVRALVESLPKIQLHCHLEGTVAPATFLALARKHGVDLGARAGIPLERVYAFTGFTEFLLLFTAVCETLRTPEDFHRVAGEYVADAAAQHVRYAELFISPSVWTHFQPDLDVHATVGAIRAALDEEGRKYGIDVALIADLTRNFGPQRALQTAQLAVSLRRFGVIGVGLGGDECRFPAALFTEAFAYAREHGLHCVAHAGETTNAKSIWDAIDFLGAERIGHGIRASEDPVLMKELAARRIALEICPTSNRLTGAVPAEQAHPIGVLDACGVLCVIDADDPALFGTTLTQEYLGTAELLGTQGLLRMARTAIEASFACDERKTIMRRELEAALTCRT